VTAAEHQAAKKFDVPSDNCGCGSASSFVGWKGTEDHDRALSQTWLGRLVLALRERLERLTRR